MKELNEYRAHLIKKLITSTHEFRAACLAVDNPFAAIEADGWNVHQIATHARDVENLVYGLRIKRTITEDNPIFQNFDSEAYAREHYSPNESLQAILDSLVNSVEALVELLRERAAEEWSRISSHEKLGNGLTLQLWVERSLAHIEEHLETVKKAS